MKTWVKVLLSVVVILVLLIGALVSYVIWDNREIPVERPPVIKEEVLKPFELKREIYGDPDIFDQPRIQFSWHGPNREKTEIWSVKIDGTDLRLAVDANLLYPKDGNLGLQPGFNTYRSPDNRYILVMLGEYSVSYVAVYIIDLKSQTRKKIEDTQHAFLIRYPWVSDSKSFFYLRGETGSLSRYYLESEKIESIKETSSKSFYVQQTAEIINQIGIKDLIRLDFNGNELERILLGEKINNHFHNISPDGQYVSYRNMKGTILTDTKNVKDFEILSTFSAPIISYKGKKLFYSSNIEFFNYDKKIKQRRSFFKKYGGHQYNDKTGFQIASFSLFNERISDVK